MTACPFCLILAGEAPSHPIYEMDLVVAILDIHPANPGHTLVMPRRHVHSFTELNTAELGQLATCSQHIAKAMKQGLDSCEAVTLSLADGAAAGQDVPHAHLHVIPRKKDDGLGWRAAGRLQNRDALDEIASRLKAAMRIVSTQSS